MADTDIVEILQSQRENKTRANTAIKKLSRPWKSSGDFKFFGFAKFQLAKLTKLFSEMKKNRGEITNSQLLSS